MSARRTFAVNILIRTLTATDRIQSLVTVGTLETGLVEGLEGKHTITRRTSRVNELDTGLQESDVTTKSHAWGGWCSCWTQCVVCDVVVKVEPLLEAA